MADDKRLERIEGKIDKITEHIGSIDNTLGKQHVSLQNHMARTDALEKIVLPIKTDVDMAKGALALIALIGIIAGIVAIFL